MTNLLEKAIEKTRRLTEREQDSIAALILDELGEDECWDQAFASSEDALVKLAADAIAEDRAGKTLPFDAAKLS